MVAEVNPLPSTSATTVHRCHIDGMEMVHLVDLPGLDGNEKTTKNLLKEVTNCDLIIWVLKANQPARSLDSDFKQQLDAFYLSTAHRSRKRPVIIAVLNQIDRLPPVQEWHPPYDLENPETPKAKTIKAALEYNRDLLGFTELIPLAVAENQPACHLDELKRLVDTSCQQGLQTQLNRRRLAVNSGSPWWCPVTGPSEPEGPGRYARMSDAYQTDRFFSLKLSWQTAPEDLGPGTGHHQGRHQA